MGNRHSRLFLLLPAVLLALLTSAVHAQGEQELYDRYWPAVSMAHTRVVLASKIRENVREVFVEEGETVEEDALLLRYDDRVVQARVAIAKAEADMQADIARAEARHDFYQREYERLLGILGTSQLAPCDVLDWELLCKRVAAHRTPPLQRFWNLLDDETRGLFQTGADKALTEKQRDALLKGANAALHKAGLYSPEAFEGVDLTDEAEQYLRQGVPQVEWKLNRLNRLLLGAALPDALVPCGEGGFVAESDVDKAYFQARDSALELDQLESRKQAREANLAYYEAQAAEYRIKAPVSGVIARLFIESGQTVREGQQMMELIDPNVVEVHVFLPERFTANVARGQKVQVRFPVFDAEREFEGEISVVAPEVSASTGLFQVTVLVHDGVQAVKPGAECEVRFVSDAEQQ